MIELDKVTYTYPGHGATALRDISCAIPPGIYLLLGENGAGKTTLLHLLSTLLTPSAGTVTLDGADSRGRIPTLLRSLFFLGEDEQMPASTPEAMGRLHGEPFYPAFDAEMLRDNLASFEIDRRLPFAAMSLGQRKKALISYALALNTPFLFLDEPANGLDIGSRDTLRAVIARCARPEQTIVISTHTTADFLPLFDGIIMLSRGQLLFARTMEQITERLAFGIFDIPPRRALFSLSDIGRFRSILPADDCDAPMGEVDIHLLYTALRSPQRDNILSIINQPSPSAL